jgi:T-complex protein 1 subunit eta
VLALNLELELKSEKDNAEVRLSDPAAYQEIVDAEWNIIYDKLEKCVACGAHIILSRLAGAYTRPLFSSSQAPSV